MVPAPALRSLGAAALVAVLLTACGGDDDGERMAFCAAIDDLRRADPFADLAVASPGEMRDAFAELAAGAERIADAAPGDVEVQADRYADAVDALRDEMAGAGYDATGLDTRRYADAVEEYGEAATSLGNAADATCDDG